MPIIVDLSDVIYADKSDQNLATRNAIHYLESILLETSNCVAFVSDQERSRALGLYRLKPAKIVIIPTKHEIDPSLATKSFTQREHHVCMAGTTHPHNIRSIEYAISSIWPLIARLSTKTELHIFGKDTDKINLTKIANPTNINLDRVKLIGAVSDFKGSLSQYRVHLVPTVSGVGIKTKVLDSFSVGTPVAGTPKCLDGTGITPGQGAYTSNEPSEIAAYCHKLIVNEVFWEESSSAARSIAQKIEDKYNIDDQCKKALSIAISSIESQNLQNIKSTHPIFLHAIYDNHSYSEIKKVFGYCQGLDLYDNTSGIIDSHLRLITQIESEHKSSPPPLPSNPFSYEIEKINSSPDAYTKNPDWKQAAISIRDTLKVLFLTNPQIHRFAIAGTVDKNTNNLLQLTRIFDNSTSILFFENPLELWSSLSINLNIADTNKQDIVNDFINRYNKATREFLTLNKLRPARTILVDIKSFNNPGHYKSLIDFLGLSCETLLAHKTPTRPEQTFNIEDPCHSTIQLSNAWQNYLDMQKIAAEWRYIKIAVNQSTQPHI